MEYSIVFIRGSARLQLSLDSSWILTIDEYLYYIDTWSLSKYFCTFVGFMLMAVYNGFKSKPN